MNLSDLRFKVTSDSEPIGSRFRALFTLKSLNTIEAIEILSLGFQDESELLKHEVAYVLGQMKNPLAIPILSSVLADLNQQTMVRHEVNQIIFKG